jgi:hypothetical protein
MGCRCSPARIMFDCLVAGRHGFKSKCLVAYINESLGKNCCSMLLLLVHMFVSTFFVNETSDKADQNMTWSSIS